MHAPSHVHVRAKPEIGSHSHNAFATKYSSSVLSCHVDLRRRARSVQLQITPLTFNAECYNTLSSKLKNKNTSTQS